MEIVFFGIAITIIAISLTANYTAKGIGSMSDAMRQFSLFILNKAPAGMVDLFDDKAGSGARTWINFGVLWFVFASICGFLGLWHNYDPTALDSLASIGWSYDNGDALAATTTKFLTVAVFSTLVGAGLVSISRNAGGKMASEASASLSAMLFTLTTIFAALLPSLLGLLGQDINSTANALLIDAISKLPVAMIVAGLFVNVLLTVANRGEEDVSTSAWFLIFALLIYILSMFMGFFGELASSTQTVWLAGQMASGWVTLSLIFAAAYHIIPMTSGTPIWSGSMRKANLLLLFATLPPFFIASANASSLLLNFGAIAMTLGLLPIIAGSVNLLLTAAGNTSSIVKSPGALAATLAMVMMPFFAVGAFFTGMDVFVGTGQLGNMATTVDLGFLWTVGGLMILSGAYTSYPLACSKEISQPSKANLTVWFVLFGGFASTITSLIGDFTIQAVANSGVEDAVAQSGGFYLVGAALFYFTAIAAIMASMVLIRTSAGKLSPQTQASLSDISTYQLGDGVTTIRTLLGRGVGIDTNLVVGEVEEGDGGSTVIAVSAALHNDEVSEFPLESESTDGGESVTEDGVSQEPENAKELVMLADYLTDSEQTIFQFFKSIDLDDSGMIDAYEFQMALKSADIANLPPWEMDSLLSAVDLDGDGQINLPELDIAIAKIRSSAPPQESEPEASSIEVPSVGQLNKMKKGELVELADSLNLDSSGTKKELISLIVKA